MLARLRERILGFASSHIQREAAEDVAQDVLMLLHTKYAHVTELTELVPLAMQIARFKIRERVRKSVRRGEHEQVPVEEELLADPGETPEALAERKELLQRLHDVLPKMGERCRRLLLYKLQGKSFAEIQRLFAVDSINTIYTWDLRCRKELRERMEGSAGRKGGTT
ncbi:MAG: sigma-70 family RNA polymerase sigma factor [Bryobacterales bacterium]|nr:sigma-70 family RNA polymerase sigma factor [Bryobacterales bacterium]